MIKRIFIMFLFVVVLGSTFLQNVMGDDSLQQFPVSCGIGLISIVSLILLIIVSRFNIHFNICDLLFSIMIGYYISRYDFQQELANWKITYAILLLILWFSIRIIFSKLPSEKGMVLFAFITVGCIQAVWGLLQLYGFYPSNHSLYRMTGSFCNPGPYSGYLAMIIPICLHQLFHTKGQISYFLYFALILMVSIIPASMSRAAWLSIILSCLWVLSVNIKWKSCLNNYAKLHIKTLIFCAFTLSITLVCLLYFFYFLKPDSVYGRFFVWSNVITMISDRPFFGYGPGSFPSVYGLAQRTYFAAGNYTSLEERIADCPEYAYNEFLQLGVEGGGVLLILCIVLLFFVLRKVFSSGHMVFVLA